MVFIFYILHPKLKKHIHIQEQCIALVKMHDLWVCSNKCCNRYKPGYAEAVEWMNTQPPFKSIKTTITGYRLCNHCGADNSWVDRACPGCGTRFGMLEPDNSDDEEQKPIEKSQPDDVHMAEMMKAEMMRNLPAQSANEPLLPMPDIQPVRDDAEDDQDNHPQCEVCEWYNPRGIKQCERCTAFLPFIG